MNKILELKNIYKNYQCIEKEEIVLNDINFSLNEGDFLGIVGPSGSGKSTLLSIISELEKPTKGKVIKKNNLKIAYMLQDDTLMPFLTVLDNCLLGLKIKRICNKDNNENVKNLLIKYGLKDQMNKYPDELSGGQKQRASLIRALSLSPDLLLLDEPFSALDYQTRIKISNDVRNIVKNEKKSLIIVTHDISEAVNMCNKIIVLSDKPSKIKNIYDIDYEYKKDPIENRLSEGFMKYYKLIWRDLNNE
ncbi:MAG: ABC transporter ATP-binding protein [Bacilli bacterium]|nr:ABC transporter ATP-binding protein [Bacilli bacterium]